MQIHDALARWPERAIRFEKRHHRFRPIMDVELAIDRRQVEFHGMDRDTQVPGDLPIRHALCHQLHHLRFARGERTQREGSVIHHTNVDNGRRISYDTNEQRCHGVDASHVASLCGSLGCTQIHDHHQL